MADWKPSEGHWNGAPTDREDALDIINKPAGEKLTILCNLAKEHYQQDPRGGGFAFVARPRVIAQLWSELPQMQRDLAKTMSYGDNDGKGDGDVVGYWCNIPIKARHNVKDDNVNIMKLTKLRPSAQQDRQLAGEMRMRAARGMPLVETFEGRKE